MDGTQLQIIRRAVPEPHQWKLFANCRGYPSDWFVGFIKPHPRALELCTECIVREHCEAAAPSDSKVTVLYGGKVFEGDLVGKGGRPRSYGCGTPQTRRRHRRSGEVCFRCYPETGQMAGVSHPARKRRRTQAGKRKITPLTRQNAYRANTPLENHPKPR